MTDFLEELSISELAKLNKEMERELCKKNLIYLCKNYLGYEDINEKLHGEIASVLAEEKEDKLFILPRGHLKTSIITVAGTIQYHLNNPNNRTLILSADWSKAADILSEIKQHLLNPALQELFPEIIPRDPEKEGMIWNQGQITLKRTKVVQGNTIECNTIMSGLTGKHFERIVFDDIQDIENSQTAESVAKVIARYRNCASVLQTNGTRIVVGTRWKIEDVYKFIMDLGTYRTLRKSVTDENGDVIYPEKFDEEYLQKLKNEIGPFFYSCQYMNQPLASEHVVFKNIKTCDSYPKKFKKIYMLIDPAISQSRAADDSVISVIGESLDEDDPLYVLESWGFKAPVQQIVDNIFEKYAQYSVWTQDIKVCVETVAYQHALKQWIEKDQNKNRQYFTVEELRPGSRKKQVRISALQPLFNNNGVLLYEEGCEQLIIQLSNYPASLHDDHVDALAYILDVVKKNSHFDVLFAGIYGGDPNTLEGQIAMMGRNSQSWRDY